MNSQPDTTAHGPAQPRQLIIGCDGTNNTLTGGFHDTNVLKLIGQLAPASAGQLLFYDPGVGAPDQVPPLGFINELTRKRERLAGLAVGKGIYENIAQAYEFLIDNFQPEDQIYIFGFSRGAFTARCIAGMVNLFGILRPESKPLILTLIRVYFSTPSEDDVPGAKRWARMIADRAEKHKAANEWIAQATNIRSPNPGARNVLAYLSKKKLRRSTRSEVADQVREKFTSPHGSTAVVHFTGVWDTVSSVGAPMFQRRITSSGTTSDKKYLRHIRQALSLDEHRLSFKPRLYWEDDYPDTDDFDPLTSPSLRQRWFRGVHSDVGGGYVMSYLDITTCAPSPPRSSAHALGAILADFPLIAAYGWFLGLYASWAFAAMAGHRRPDDKVSPLFRLGLAPMFAVVADLVEDVLTLLTLWLIWRGWPTASLIPGVLMMLANLAKWGGLLASLALMGYGIQGAKGPRPNSPTRLQR